MVSPFSDDTGLNADEPQGAESRMEAGSRHSVALAIPQSSISQAIDSMLDGIEAVLDRRQDTLWGCNYTHMC